MLKQSDENTDANALLPLCLWQMLKLENSELWWEADFCLRLLLNKFSCSTFAGPSSYSSTFVWRSLWSLRCVPPFIEIAVIVSKPVCCWPFTTARRGENAERVLKVFWSAVFSSQTLLKWHLRPVPLETRVHWCVLFCACILTCFLSSFFWYILRLSLCRSYFSGR